MINREVINKLYTSYEFDKVMEEPAFNVYIYDQGYFYNAEIVCFQNSDEDIKKSRS